LNWKNEAIDDLRTYRDACAGAVALAERIDILNEQISTAEGEDVIGILSERERLRGALSVTKRGIKLVEKGLDGLNSTEKRILFRCFVEDGSGAVEDLADELGYEARRVYDLRNAALAHFTMRMFGRSDG